MKKISTYLILTLLVVSFTACKSRTQKMHEFVEGFNQTAQMRSNGNISAKVEGLDQITMDLGTPLDINDPASSSAAQLMEKSIPSMFQRDETMMELINEAVKFKIHINDANGRIITTLDVDKTFLDNQNKGSLIKSGSNDPITVALEAFNSNLPMKNADGSRLMKIEKSGPASIAYTLEVPDDVKEILESPNATPLVKESLKNDPTTRNSIQRMRSLGIQKVTYILIDTQAKQLSTFDFKSSEF